MTADLTPEPKSVEAAREDLRLIVDADVRRIFPQAVEEELDALQSAVLAEARPQWRKQVAEELRREVLTEVYDKWMRGGTYGKNGLSVWLTDQLQERAR